MNLDMNRTLQQQSLSQAQIQALTILAMDNAELNQFMKNEYLENPLLDHVESRSSEAVSEPITTYYESMSPVSGSRAVGSSDEDEERRTRDFRAPKENSLQEYLLSQLDVNLYTRQEWQLFGYLTGCLDDNGFFTMPIEEVVDKTHASAEMVDRALRLLKTLEPYGVFSENLQECLLRQLDAQDMNSEVLTSMLLFHMEDIAAGRISNISRTLRISTMEVRKNIELISRLNPRPLSGFGEEKNSYIIPDIILSREGGNWTIALNDSWVENYHRNEYYLKMMASATDKDLTDYFRNKLERVNFILQSIEQRRRTILSVSQAILDMQKGFFEGKESLRPMVMSDIAEKTGLHTSTVSRAIKGKYLQYPKGGIFLRKLFSAAVASTDDRSISPATVKQYIREMIEAEDKAKPYSDQTIAGLLTGRNINISRRTVAKYREELGIKGSLDRRCFS